MSGEHNAIPAASGFDLEDVLHAARRCWGWLLIGLLLGVAASVWVYHRFPPHYTGRSLVLVESSWFPKSFLESPIGGSLRERLQTIEHRLASDRAMDWLVAEIDPDGDADAFIGRVRREFALEVVNGSSQEAAVFAISYESADPEQARAVVAALTRYLSDERREERTRQAGATARLLREQADAVDGELQELAGRLEETEARGAAGASGADRHALRTAALSSLQALRAELARAESTYTDRHPQLRQLRAEFARQRRELGAALGAAGADGEPSARHRALLQEYDSKLRTYESLVGRQIEASMAERLEGSQASPEIHVLREASVQRFPSQTDLPLFLAGGAGAGLLLASALVLLPVLRRPSFSRVEGLQHESGLPVIASIPALPDRIGRSRRRATPQRIDPQVVVVTAPHCAAAEQYRRFLPYLREAGESPTILLTSAERGEGKSLTAANLAASAAVDGQRRVLLIDTDLRCPTLHRRLLVKRFPGVTDCVRDGIPLSHAASPTAVPGLLALGAGRLVESPLRVLEDERFLKLIEEARREFGVVFLDAPPLLPVVDAKLLERLASLVLFVVRADRTPKSSVVRSLAELRVPVGLVMNGIAADSYRRYYRSDPYRAAYRDEKGAA